MMTEEEYREYLTDGLPHEEVVGCDFQKNHYFNETARKFEIPSEYGEKFSMTNADANAIFYILRDIAISQREIAAKIDDISNGVNNISCQM